MLAKRVAHSLSIFAALLHRRATAALPQKRMSSLSFPEHMASGGSLPRPTGSQRVTPGPGQQSVWEPPFTRPPTIRDVAGRHAIVRIGEDGPVLIDSRSGVQVCEISHPPTWYFPMADVRMGHLRRIGGGSTLCEFKGQATYFDVMASADGADDAAAQPAVAQAAWTYARTDSPIEGRVALYLRPPLVATVDGKRVTPQQGDFYGGWITDDVVGPFKGGPGTRLW